MVWLRDKVPKRQVFEEGSGRDQTADSKDIICFKKNQVGYKRVPSTRFPRESLMCNGQQCIDVHINTLSTVSGDIFSFR